MKRMLLALSLSLPAYVSANEFQVPCPALVQSCLSHNQALVDAGSRAALYWRGRFEFVDSQDFDAAYLWYQRSAALGYAPAIRTVGLYHLHGAGSLVVDRSQALALLTKAAAQGDGKAYFLLYKLDDGGDVLAMLN